MAGNTYSYELPPIYLEEEITVGSQKGNFVLNEIVVSDGVYYASGNFQVEAGGNSVDRQFMMALDADSSAGLKGLGVRELKAHVNEDVFRQMLAGTPQEIVFSSDVSFPDRLRLAGDMNKLQSMGEGTDHIRLLALMGQDHPEFVGHLDRYLNQGMGSDQSIKLAALDSVGITDPLVRERMLYASDNLTHFSTMLKEHVGFDNTKNLGALSAIGEQSKLLRQAAAAEAAVGISADTVKAMSAAARAGRLGGHIPVAGVAAAGLGMVMSTAASAAQRDYADDLFAQGHLSEEALVAYKTMSLENDIIVKFDETVAYADPSGAAILATIGVEMRAREAFEGWADRYAPNLPSDMIDTLSMSMLKTESAQGELLLGVARSLPDSIEDVPPELHDLIAARQDYIFAQEELERSAQGMMSMSAAQNDRFMELSGLRDQAHEGFVLAMEKTISDPKSAAAFLDVMPVDDRLNFIRRLVESDPNPEAMTARHPEIAAYVAAYKDANIFQTRIFGFDEDTKLRENMDFVTDYILERSGIAPEPEPDLDEIRNTIDALIASGGVPEDAPPELAALAELQNDPERQTALFNDLKEDGMAVVAQHYAQVYAEEHRVADASASPAAPAAPAEQGFAHDSRSGGQFAPGMG